MFEIKHMEYAIIPQKREWFFLQNCEVGTNTKELRGWQPLYQEINNNTND